MSPAKDLQQAEDATTQFIKRSPTRVWASLFTTVDYLPGILTLDYCLRSVGSSYPLVALYTDAVPAKCLTALDARGIRRRKVPMLSPSNGRTYAEGARFNETWTKLVTFSLVEYDRVVLLDSDMLVRQNMDELMTLELDDPALEGKGSRVFAATHACACNPVKRAHYPANWVPANCAYTSQHADPENAQFRGPPVTSGVGMLNSGLLVINPSASIFSQIQAAMNDAERVKTYDFPDQGLLSDIFCRRWVPLPYIYNGLKTLRWEGVHSAIWRDARVKVVHYIFANKPWNDDPGVQREVLVKLTNGAHADGNGHLTHESDSHLSNGHVTNGKKKNHFDNISDETTHRWWWVANANRRKDEQSRGLNDGF